MRAVVWVATGSYVRGIDRLTEWCAANGEEYFTWRDRLPTGSPSHQDVPYAFKAFALQSAWADGAGTLLWCDSCIIPVKPLDELWERIERDGYWIGSQAGPEPDQGYTNYEWTADSAYPILFGGDHPHLYDSHCLGSDRVLNRKIPHVAATAFGVSMEHPIGRAILDQYFRLASETKAFCGPWRNTNMHDDEPTRSGKWAPCGPPDVRGHRHDQTALSVIAWRLGCNLTRWPDVFAYAGHQDERTILVADGGFTI